VRIRGGREGDASQCGGWHAPIMPFCPAVDFLAKMYRPGSMDNSAGIKCLESKGFFKRTTSCGKNTASRLEPSGDGDAGEGGGFADCALKHGLPVPKLLPNVNFKAAGLIINMFIIEYKAK
jgi:hypothetical protein